MVLQNFSLSVICVLIIDKQLEVDAVPGTKSKREGIRARSRSMVNGVRKLTRLHSFSGSVPRYSYTFCKTLFFTVVVVLFTDE